MSEQESARIGRRGFVATVGAASCALAAGGVERPAAPATPGPVPEPAPAELAVGLQLPHGWTLEGIHPLHLGAVPVSLRGPHGEHVQVDILRRDDGGPAPVARTRHYALHVANRGDGRRPTVETQGLAVMALADVLRDREGAAPSVPELLSLRERRARHPVGIYSVG